MGSLVCFYTFKRILLKHVFIYWVNQIHAIINFIVWKYAINNIYLFDTMPLQFHEYWRYTTAYPFTAISNLLGPNYPFFSFIPFFLLSHIIQPTNSDRPTRFMQPAAAFSGGLQGEDYSLEPPISQYTSASNTASVPSTSASNVIRWSGRRGVDGRSARHVVGAAVLPSMYELRNQPVHLRSYMAWFSHCTSLHLHSDTHTQANACCMFLRIFLNPS